MPAVTFTRPQLHALLKAIGLAWEAASPVELLSLNLAEVKIRGALKDSWPKFPREAA